MNQWINLDQRSINQPINQSINETMNQFLPDKPSEARAYGLPKTHKKLEEGNKIPPLRLVISGCGSNTENASFYVDHHTKHIPETLHIS